MSELSNNNGHLIIGGCDAVDLAKRFGTPLYVYDEAKIRAVCREFKAALPNELGRVCFASKAFSTKALVRIIDQEGLGLDVTSGGELYTALSVGLDPSRITFHGNNKTPEEIEYAVCAGVGTFAIDNPNEIALIAAAARAQGVVQKVALRVNPGVEAHTHAYIQTSVADCKFGFAPDVAVNLAKEILATEGLLLTGINCHIGSQILELEPYELATREMVCVAAKIKTETAYELPELILGGGFGVRYTSGDTPHPFEAYISLMLSTLRDECAKHGLSVPLLIIEPGRAIVAEAGTTLYTVGSRRDQSGRIYVSVDGGMGDNPRPMLYQALYCAALANKMNAPAEESVTIAGRFCESGDILIERSQLPVARAGDTLAVFTTGAYNYAMASNYNRVPKPAAVLVKDGKAELLIKRQTYEELAMNDCVPDWLERGI